jgi:DNA-binding LacI/PurR family transcriptional regulator
VSPCRFGFGGLADEGGEDVRLVCLRGSRTAVADRRLVGFLGAMPGAGVAVRQEWIAETEPGEADYHSGIATMKRLLTGKTRRGQSRDRERAQRLDDTGDRR